MAIDNQVLLGAVLVVGVGYIILRGQPAALPQKHKDEINAQNLKLQLDGAQGIFHDFRREHKQKGRNAKMAPLTQEEKQLLEDLKTNLERLEKDAKEQTPFSGNEFAFFEKRKDELRRNIAKYENEYDDYKQQNKVNAKTTDLSLGAVVGPGKHKGKFVSVAGEARARRGGIISKRAQRDRSRSAARSRSAIQDRNALIGSLSHGSQHANINTQHFAKTSLSRSGTPINQGRFTATGGSGFGPHSLSKFARSKLDEPREGFGQTRWLSLQAGERAARDPLRAQSEPAKAQYHGEAPAGDWEVETGPRGFLSINPEGTDPYLEEPRQKRGAWSVGADSPRDQTPFKVVPPNDKLLNNDDAPRADKVGKDAQGAFESSPPEIGLDAKRQKSDADEENLKVGGTKGAKETPSFIGPIPDMMESSDLKKPSFVSAEGLEDDDVVEAPVAEGAELRSRTTSASPAPPATLAAHVQKIVEMSEPGTVVTISHSTSPDMDSAKEPVPEQDNAEYQKLTAQVEAYFEVIGSITDKASLRRTIENVKACLMQLELLGSFQATQQYNIELDRLSDAADDRLRRKKKKRPVNVIHDTRQHANFAAKGAARAKKPRRHSTPIKRPGGPPPAPEVVRAEQERLQTPRGRTSLRRIGPPNLDSAPGGKP